MLVFMAVLTWKQESMRKYWCSTQLEPSRTKFKAHVEISACNQEEILFSAKVKIFAYSSIEFTIMCFYLCAEQNWS